jgi:hypothetical protein
MNHNLKEDPWGQGNRERVPAPAKKILEPPPEKIFSPPPPPLGIGREKVRKQSKERRTQDGR